MALLQKAYLGATPLFVDRPWYYNIDSKLASYNTDITTNVTASSTAHTKGAWSQIIASTANNTTLLTLYVFNNASATDTASLLDIGIGASGSETVVAENISVGGLGGAGAGFGEVNIQLPLKIPSGSRVAARMQSAVSSRAALVGINVYNFGGYNVTPDSVDVLGTDSATSTGTQLSASNAWTQIVASTSQDYAAVTMVPSLTDANFTAGGNHIFQLGIGASGSETVIQELSVRATSAELLGLRAGQFCIAGKNINAGTRIAVRQSSATTAFDACVVGIPIV